MKRESTESNVSKTVKTKYRNAKYANLYDAKRYGGIFKKIKENNTRSVIQKAISMLPAGSTIFDMPCGTGRFGGLCASSGHGWIGADISLEMMTVSKQKSALPNGLFENLQCDGENIPLKSNSVTATLTIRFLLQLPRETRINILKELRRISSEYVIVDYNHSDNLKHFFRKARVKAGLARPKRRLPLSLVTQEINEAGLSIIKIMHVSKLFSDDAVIICKK